MLIETEDEMKRSPTAIPKGFFSGFASDTMARKDEALFAGSSPEVDSNRVNSTRFKSAFGAGVGGVSGFSDGTFGAS